MTINSEKILKYIGIFLIYSILICIFLNSCNKSLPKCIDVTGTVYEKIDVPKSHKSSKITTDFIMIIKTDDGHYFDLSVSHTTFVMNDIGSRLTFYDVNYSTVYPNDKEYRKNKYKHFLISTGSIILIFGFSIFLFKLNDKNN